MMMRLKKYSDFVIVLAHALLFLAVCYPVSNTMAKDYLNPLYASYEDLEKGYKRYIDIKDESEYNMMQFVAFSGYLARKCFEEDNYREGARYIEDYFVEIGNLDDGRIYGKPYTELLSLLDRKWILEKDYDDIVDALTYIAHALERTIGNRWGLLEEVYKKLISYAKREGFEDDVEEFQYLLGEAREE